MVGHLLGLIPQEIVCIPCLHHRYCLLHCCLPGQRGCCECVYTHGQAMDVIMARVEALDAPLRTEADCDRVRGGGVGKDNVEKLKVVVRTGTFRRNETLAKDPHHQAIKLVRPPRSQGAGPLAMSMCRRPLWGWQHCPATVS